MTKQRRLLIIACSATKRQTAPGEVLPAIGLYDGPGYRTLRKHLMGDTTVLILSAEHGILEANQGICWYDQKMSREVARTLRERGHLDALEPYLLEEWDAVHVHAGATYREALPVERLKAMGATFARGGIGEQLGQLKAWLLGEEVAA